MEIYLSGDFKGTLLTEALYNADEGGYLRTQREMTIGN
jgi:hypothetical protein